MAGVLLCSAVVCVCRHRRCRRLGAGELPLHRYWQGGLLSRAYQAAEPTGQLGDPTGPGSVAGAAARHQCDCAASNMNVNCTYSAAAVSGGCSALSGGPAGRPTCYFVLPPVTMATPSNYLMPAAHWVKRCSVSERQSLLLIDGLGLMKMRNVVGMAAVG